MRLKQRELGTEPARAVLDFLGVRHPIMPFFLTRKAAADGSEVNAISDFFFIEAYRLEPLEESFPGAPGKGLAEGAFPASRGLADEQNLGRHGFTRNYGRDHLCAPAALLQVADVRRDRSAGFHFFHLRIFNRLLLFDNL